MNIFATTKQPADAVASVAFTATDEKNPNRVMNFLYAIHSQVIKPLDKCTTLSSVFSDNILRNIGTECSNRATELVEDFKSERKHIRRSQSTDSAHKRAADLKKSMADFVLNTPATTITFASPRRGERGELNPRPTINDMCYGTTPIRNLNSEFIAEVITLRAADKAAVAARLQNEAARQIFSPEEIREAEEVLTRETQSLNRDMYSVEKENEALDRIFRIACVLILKNSAHEELHTFYKAGTNKYNWDIQIGDPRLNLDRQTENFKAVAYSAVKDNTPARTACGIYTADIVKYTWLMRLYCDEHAVTTAVKNFKSLAGMKLQTLLQGEDRTLLSSALDNKRVQDDPTALFDFLRHRLNVMNTHSQTSTKQAHFIQNEITQGVTNPRNTIHTMGAGPRGPSLQGMPGSEVYEEVRDDTFERRTNIQQKFRPQTPGRYREPEDRSRYQKSQRYNRNDPNSDWESDPGDDSSFTRKRTRFNRDQSRSPFSSREESRGRSRSMSREPPRRTRSIPRDLPNQKQDQENKSETRRVTRSTSDPALIHIIDTYNQATRRSDSQIRRPSSYTDPMKYKKIPDGACENMTKTGTTGCDKLNCAADHGIWRATNRKGEDTPQCEKERNGEPCPWLWTPNGCYSWHNVKTATKNDRAATAAHKHL